MSTISLLFLILLISKPNLTRNQISTNYRKPKTNSINEAKPKQSPTPISIRQVAVIDIEYKATGYFVPFSVTIPKGAKYYQEGEPLYIESEDGLLVMICPSCHKIINNCGGLMDGIPSQGGCAIDEISLGEGIEISMHYQPSEPDRIMGFSGKYKNINRNDIIVTATTNDFRKLSEKDRKFIYKIVNSLK